MPLRVSQTHSAPEVTQLGDFMSDRELLRLPIYSDFLRPFRSILAVALPTAPDRTRVFQLFREDAKPFSDQDITTLRLLAPHLYAIYREASARRRTPVRLTVRELDVMRCVAQGLGTRQIAEQLVVSPSTCASTWRTSSIGSGSPAGSRPSPGSSRSRTGCTGYDAGADAPQCSRMASVGRGSPSSGAPHIPRASSTGRNSRPRAVSS